ncbi:MAG: ROK family protein [Pseudomonadales bacterium]
MSGARIGIDLGGTKIAGVLLGSQQQTLCRLRRATPRGDYEATLTSIAALVEELEAVWRAEAGASDQPIPVGLGAPGVCDAETGLMAHCNSTWLNGQALRADLEKYLTRSLVIANDADCFTLSQTVLQPGLANGLLFGVILGTGVGGGWADNGQLRLGPNGLSGEWGHVPLPYFRSGLRPQLQGLEAQLDDRRCYCGRQNCIETFLSGPGLLATYQALWGDLKSIDTAEQVVAGDSDQCRATVQLYCDMLARSLAQIINVVDPQAIVLGGGLSNVALLYDALPKQIPAYLFSRPVLSTSINAPLGGDDSGVIGAALLTLRMPSTVPPSAQ